MCIGIKYPSDKHTNLTEFAYNNSFCANISMILFKSLYRRPYRSPQCWDEVGAKAVRNLLVLQHYAEQVEMIRKRLFII